MNLYLVTQNANTGQYTYEFAVVAAETEEEAKTVHPFDETWAKCANQVSAEYLGIAKEETKKGIIIPAFNEG